MSECVRIEHDAQSPTAAVELTILHPLPDYDLNEVEAAVPREVDVMLASQGFHDLIDEAFAVLAKSLDGKFEIVQLTGAICGTGSVHRPGLWLVLRETGLAAGAAMSAAGRAQVSKVADDLCDALQLR